MSRGSQKLRYAVALISIGASLALGFQLLHSALQESWRTNRLLALAARQSDLCLKLRPDSPWDQAREASFLELQKARDEWAELSHEPARALQGWLEELRHWRFGEPRARAVRAWRACTTELSRRQNELSVQASIETQHLREMQQGWLLGLTVLVLAQAFLLLSPGQAPRRRERPATHLRLEANLEAAARVQRSLLPEASPVLPGVEFAWQYQPCEKVAGDMYGVQVLDENRVGLYVLDVSGHGIPAALLSVSLSRALSDVDGLLRRRSPSEVVRELNRRFPVMGQSDQFITLLYGVLDLEQSTFTYVRAGHPGPVLCRPTGLMVQEDDQASPPIGIFEEVEFRDEVLLLMPGDRVLVYTDGITEAPNEDGEMFGSQRLAEALAEMSQARLKVAMDGLLERVNEFGGRLRDDLTVLAFELAIPAREPVSRGRWRKKLQARDLVWCALHLTEGPCCS
ncbi:hypothetical protein DYH09_00350 [bacterium CPR1]|nr:hypothetical protein [bacterium CPR1]